MSVIILIFLLAFGFTGLVHAVTAGDEGSHKEAEMVSSFIIIAAWLIAVARLISLAQYPH